MIYLVCKRRRGEEKQICPRLQIFICRRRYSVHLLIKEGDVGVLPPPPPSSRWISFLWIFVGISIVPLLQKIFATISFKKWKSGRKILELSSSPYFSAWVACLSYFWGSQAAGRQIFRETHSGNEEEPRMDWLNECSSIVGCRPFWPNTTSVFHSQSQNAFGSMGSACLSASSSGMGWLQILIHSLRRQQMRQPESFFHHAIPSKCANTIGGHKYADKSTSLERDARLHPHEQGIPLVAIN